MAVGVKDFDHPVLLLFFITIGVVAMIGLFSYLAQLAGLSGLLSLLKGGVAPMNREPTH